MVFVHGLMSDMNGQKSIFFNNYCRKKNFSFLCFDFRGHGKSSGDFIEFGIKDWYEDLKSLISHLNLKNITLIGSSMGGWVAMLYALNFAKNVDRLIGIAAAPDFTKDLLWKELSDKNKDLIIGYGLYLYGTGGYSNGFDLSPRALCGSSKMRTLD